MFAITYSPPCWVQNKTQQEMKNCKTSSAVYVHGYELWENSASRKEGFEEFLKFCRYLEDRGVCRISFFTAAKIWNIFKTWNPTVQNLYDPFSDSVWCEKCRIFVFEGNCGDCHQHETVFSVAMSCLE